MPTLHSHTHLQATQAIAQTKACIRVCLPNRINTATFEIKNTTEKEGRTHNSGLAKVAVQFSEDSFVVNQSLVLCINICGKNRHLLITAKRLSEA
jgi:hypothetical protein